MVSISIYDTKPVYFLSSSCETIEWTKKERKVYNPESRKTFKLPFYRLNIIDFYNNNMGNVDLADQLRNHYRYDSVWHRNRKWWWSIWWWGYQLLLTNSFVLYCKYHRMIDSNQAVSHYDYIKTIALGWINQDTHWPKQVKLKKRKADKEVDDGKRHTRATTRKLYSSSSQMSSSSSKTKQIKDKTLDPIRGELNCRLQTSVQHFPVRQTTKTAAKCQLHRWARRGTNGKEVRKGVFSCSYCQVHLCIDCFKLFHIEANLIQKKEEIAVPSVDDEE